MVVGFFLVTDFLAVVFFYVVADFFLVVVVRFFVVAVVVGFLVVFFFVCASTGIERTTNARSIYRNFFMLVAKLLFDLEIHKHLEHIFHTDFLVSFRHNSLGIPV